jgi:hypothetical protein
MASENFVAVESCRYLYLIDLGEPQDNTLRILVQEADLSAGETTLSVAGTKFTELRRIEPTRASRSFELVWNSYVAYSVRNESLTGMGKDYEVFIGRLIRVYTTSHFLDYVTKATFAGADYPGPLKHVGIACLNHDVDVIAIELPIVTALHG